MRAKVRQLEFISGSLLFFFSSFNLFLFFYLISSSSSSPILTHDASDVIASSPNISQSSFSISTLTSPQPHSRQSTTSALYTSHPPTTSTMCIVFTCGEHTFRKEIEGYEGVVCRCYNCGNYSGRVIKTHPWFTLCFVVSFFVLAFVLTALAFSSLLSSLRPPFLHFVLAALTFSSLLSSLRSLCRRPLANSTARHPPLDPRLRRCHLPHLQLLAAARAPPGRADDAPQRWPDTDAATRLQTTASRTRTTTRTATTTAATTRAEWGHAVRLTKWER